MYRKNISSQYVYFCLVNATTGAALSGASVTVAVTIDSGSQSSGGGSVTGLGNGQYRYNLSSGDTNGNQIGLMFTATNAVPVNLTIITTAADPTSSTNFGLSALPTASAGASSGLHINGSNSGTTTYAALTVTGTFTISDGLAISRSSSNSHALSLTGSGTGKDLNLAAQSTNMVLAKTTNITGFNDIAASSVVVGGAISTTSGSVTSVLSTGITSSIGTGGISRATFAADTGLVTALSNQAQAGGTNSITLNAGASSSNDFYKDMWVKLTSGTGVGQTRLITAYNGSTKVATTSPDWITNPDSSTNFAILDATGLTGATAPTAAQVATAVWQDTTSSDFTVSGSIGKSLFTSGVVPGGSGGLFISGTNAGTTTVAAFTCTDAFTISNGLFISATTTNRNGITVGGNGLGSGLYAYSSGTGNGFWLDGGYTSGAGFRVSTSSGNAVQFAATNGNGFECTGNGTNKVGALFSATSSGGIGLSCLGGSGTGKGLNAQSIGGTAFSGDLSGSVTSVVNGVTVTTNNDKTGYSLTQTFPTNFSALSITSGGLVDITQAAADKAWSTSTRVLTAGTNIVLAKGTGVTGFNDLSATQVENAVWNASVSSHTTSGTFGAASAPSAAAIATAVWTDTTSTDFNQASSIGKSLYTSGVVPGGSGGLFIAGSNAATTVNITGSLSGSVGSISGITFPTNFSSFVIDGSGRVDVSKLAGTTQTARDIGASVLLSNGIGTGQILLGSGQVTVGTNNDKTGYSLSQSFPSNFSSLSIDGSGRVDVGKTLGTAVTLDANSVLNVSTKYLAGISQTGRDIGSSVLLSPGTSTGQLDITSGVVKSNITQISGSAVSTSTAQLGVNVVNWNGTATTSSIPPDTILIRSGTAQGGAASTITLDSGASATNDLYKNETIFIRSGTGVGQSNVIASYVGSTKVATLSNTWATTPDNTSVFTILAIGPSIATATVSGIVNANVVQWNSSAVASPATAGVPEVNVKNINNVSTSSVSTVNAFIGNSTASLSVDASGRVDVGKIKGTTSAGAAGYVGIDWANITAPTSTVNLSGTTIGTLTTYTGNTPQTGDSYARLGTPSGASIAADIAAISSNNAVMQSGTATAGGASTITIQTALGADSLPNGCLIKLTGGTGANQARTITGYVNSTKVVTVDRAWVTNPDSSTNYSILYADSPALNSSLKVSGVVLTDSLTTYTGNTPQSGDAYARLGTPANASTAADIASVKTDTGAIKTKTDFLPSVTAGASGGLFIAGTNAATTVTTAFTTTFTGNLTGTVGNLASGAKTDVENSVWDGLRSSHVTAGSFGRYAQIIRDGTAQAGAAGTITLDASASSSNSFYNNCLVYLIGGTGVGQSRFITGYNGTTKVATVNSNWVTNPDNTTVFVIEPFDAIPGATAPTAAQVATAVWQDLTAGSDFTTVGSIGSLLKGFTFTVAGYVDANTLKVGGTTQTARDIGASVLLSPGTGTGQISLASGAVTVGTNNDKTGYTLSQTFPTNFATLSIDGSGRVDIGKTLGTAITLDANNVINVSTKYITGTLQTARDIGASVLLSPGTGTGQISLTSGAVTVGTNNDKTGYSLTQTFPTNFSSLAITAGGLVDITQAAADKAWGTATRVLTAGTNIVLAKGTGVTGFNDLSTTQVENSVWDATRSSHITVGSFGIVSKEIRDGTAQAGGSTTITLDASASAVNSFYNNTLAEIISGTGAGQSRFITGYVGSTKVATVNSAWATNPDNTSIFLLKYFDQVPGASAPTAAQVATAVWQDATGSDFTTSGSIGKSLFTSGAVPGAAGGLFIAGTNAATTVTTAFTTTFTGNLTGNIGGTLANLASGAKTDVENAVWDAARSGHLTIGTFGRMAQISRDNTAQAGAAGTITLDASASATNSFYNNCIIELVDGTGAGQSRFITGYVGSTKVATINSNWVTNPDNTSKFNIIFFDQVPGATAPTAAQVATAVWQDATGSDFTVSGSVGKGLFTSGAVPGTSGGLFIAGINALLTVTGTTTLSDGLVVNRSTSNATAVTLNGNGSGNALSLSPGTSGVGLYVTGGSSTGNAVTIAAPGGHGIAVSTTGSSKNVIDLSNLNSGNAINVNTASGHGFYISAEGAFGVGFVVLSDQQDAVKFEGGSSSGNGLSLVARGGNSSGFSSSGFGSGRGMVVSGGDSGTGALFIGGGTLGDAIATSATNGHGMNIAGAGTTKSGLILTRGGSSGKDLNLATPSTNMALAKGTNITGLNDLAITDITSTGGKVPITGGGLVSSDITAIATSTTAASNQRDAALAVARGTVTGATTTTTLVDSGLTQSADGHFIGRVLIIITSSLALEAAEITNFEAAFDRLTFTPLTSAPSIGTNYVIV